MRSFVELVPILVSIPVVKAFLNEKISQDPLEKFFRCRPHENPSVKEFVQNTQVLRAVDSFCTDFVKGNRCGHKRSHDESSKQLGSQEPTFIIKKRKK